MCFGEKTRQLFWKNIHRFRMVFNLLNLLDTTPVDTVEKPCTIPFFNRDGSVLCSSENFENENMNP